MSVIVEFRVPSDDFELGRILSIAGSSTIELETLVPLGETTVPLFWIHNSTRDSFVESVEDYETVSEATRVDVFKDRTLFTLDWDANRDDLISCARENDGQILEATGTPDSWKFEVRFPTHESLSMFSEATESAGITTEVTRVYNPSEPDVHPWYGLTEPQLEALTLAVRKGYYDIPRNCTTKELAAELGISDQAVTERLRRAIVAITTYTLPFVEADS